MSRGTKFFLLAIVVGLVAWVIGVTLIGYAEVTYFTNSGAVDMLNANAVASALGDPSFTATVSWGGITLRGAHWTFAFPLLLGFLAFVCTLFVARLRRRAP
jgi:hypothetical protein